MNTHGAEGGGSAGGKRRRRTPPGPSREGERRRRRAPAAAAPACASRRWPVRVGMERERERPMGRGRGGQRGAGRGRAPPSCPRATAEVRSPPGGRRRPGRRRFGRDRERMGRGAYFFRSRSCVYYSFRWIRSRSRRRQQEAVEKLVKRTRSRRSRYRRKLVHAIRAVESKIGRTEKLGATWTCWPRELATTNVNFKLPHMATKL